MKRLIAVTIALGCSLVQAKALTEKDKAHIDTYCKEIERTASLMMMQRQMGFGANELLHMYAPAGAKATAVRLKVVDMVRSAIMYPVADTVSQKSYYHEKFKADNYKLCVSEMEEEAKNLK